ncbi:hypothetical protein CO660_25340 [Rhizobium sp. L9]|nr:hypothetical protein CO660_25340 [Rhizobium sp. L9]
MALSFDGEEAQQSQCKFTRWNARRETFDGLNTLYSSATRGLEALYRGIVMAWPNRADAQ